MICYLGGRFVLNKNHGTVIKYVQPDSIAMEAGIGQGDILVSVCGQCIQDVFDYRYLITEENLSIEVKKKDGEIWDIEIEKDEYEDIGLDFEDSLMDEAKSCTNKCIFCFIDQLPPDMRSSMYFKDDDSRLSFLSGNYVTLTNMKSEDIDRIIKYKMSPINISVHTTNPELRKFMLGSRFAADVLQKIKRLVGGGISVNSQIVLCRGINDREELDRTLTDLIALYPGVASISIVPVGITKWREGLFELKPYDRESSEKVVEHVEKWQANMMKRYGSRLVYLADEFYIMSGRELPGYDEYEDFPQIENGVGLVALLKNEFLEYLNGCILAEEVLKSGPEVRHVSIATGVSVFKFIKEMVQELEKRYNNLEITVYPIKNNFFGENVTVTGLLTGGDIERQLQYKTLGSELFISRSMLKAGEEVFLDDYSVSMLEKNLKVKITIVENNGEDFINKVKGK
jgi:putative radical SAM enzyme (TIGR03279 family)